MELKQNDANMELKKSARALDASSCCHRCATTDLCLKHGDKCVQHMGIPNLMLSAAQVFRGMIVSDAKHHKGNVVDMCNDKQQ